MLRWNPLREKAPSGRLLTLWPRVEPVDPRQTLPWDALGDTVARLHSLPVEGHLPAADPRARARRAVAQVPDPTQRALLERSSPGCRRIRRRASSSTVTSTSANWANWASAASRASHLGTHATNGSQPGQWLLLDIDDLGRGHPVADLARRRPSGQWGSLADEDWTRLLAAYRRRSHVLLPPDEHLWGTSTPRPARHW